MRTPKFLVVAVAGLVVASCGGSSAVSAPNTPKQIAADKATIKQALLTADDLPLGYTGKPHDNSDDSQAPKAVVDAFVKCSGFPRRLVDTKDSDQPNLDAPDFAKGAVSQGGATEIDSSIELDRSSKDISEPVALLEKPTAAKCFGPFFDAALKHSLATEPGLTLSATTVDKLDVASVGDQAAAFQGHVTISGPGGPAGEKRSIPIEFDLYFVRSGRAIVELTGLGFSAQFDTTLAEKLLTTMVSRLKSAD